MRNPKTFEEKHKLIGLRRRLVDELREKGIKNTAVLNAIASLQRHLFIPDLDSAFYEILYADQPFRIAGGQTISQPYTVAFQTEMLQVKPGDKILEIGTGSGFQAAVLSCMGAEVHSLEIVEELHHQAKQTLEKFQLPAFLYLSDGGWGLPDLAPFDSIIVTAACPTIPKTLLAQLKIGGRISIPVGDLKTQTMTLLVRESENEFSSQSFHNFKFVPLTGSKGF